MSARPLGLTPEARHLSLPSCELGLDPRPPAIVHNTNRRRRRPPPPPPPRTATTRVEKVGPLSPIPASRPPYDPAAAGDMGNNSSTSANDGKCHAEPFGESKCTHYAPAPWRRTRANHCSNSAPTKPFVGSHDFYHFNMAVSGVCAVISIVVAMLLLFRHATHFSRPKQQLEYVRSQSDGCRRRPFAC